MRFISYTCQIRLFCSFESNSLSVTAEQERCVKEPLSQSQDCGNSFLLKVKSYLKISIYLYWFYGQEFFLLRVLTLLFRCQRLIQSPASSGVRIFGTVVDDLLPLGIVTNSPFKGLSWSWFRFWLYLLV